MKVAFTIYASAYRRMAVQHAPKGGISIGGKSFKGGEFIPGEVLEKATKEEKAKLKGGEQKEGSDAPGSGSSQRSKDLIRDALGQKAPETTSVDKAFKDAGLDFTADDITGDLEEFLGLSSDEQLALGKAWDEGGGGAVLAGVEVDIDLVEDWKSPLYAIAARQARDGIGVDGEPLQPGQLDFEGGNYEPKGQPNMEEFMSNHYPKAEFWHGGVGFLMANGDLLDMSVGGGDVRGDDHRSINPTDEAAKRWGYSKEARDNRTAVLHETMRRAGAIRVHVGDHTSIDVVSPLTNSQRSKIRSLLKDVDIDSLQIDLGGADIGTAAVGKSLDSFEITPGAVLSSIEGFFEDN